MLLEDLCWVYEKAGETVGKGIPVQENSATNQFVRRANVRSGKNTFARQG